MLTRVYVDNFRCFEKFEFRPSHFNVILGPNGAGKSSFLDVLHVLFRWVTGWSSVDELFPIENNARFSRRAPRAQSFRVDGTISIKKKDTDFSYLLEVGHTKRGSAHIEHEEIRVGTSTVYTYDGRIVIIDSGANKTRYSFDGHRSPLSTIPYEEIPTLSQCINEFAKLWVIRPVPQRIGSVSVRDVAWLLPDLSNFSDWFRGVVQTDPKLGSRVSRGLRAILDGFDGFGFEPVGSGGNRPRTLLVRFRGKSVRGEPLTLAIDELSDGQRLLLALYTLLYHVVDSGRTLCIDEPENYLALPEIQPWLDELQDLALKRHSQVFLVSHHPRVIDLLGSTHGHWFERHGKGPVRAERIAIAAKGGDVSLATLVERGWIHG